MPDKEMGEIIKVWVVLRPDWRGKITEEGLRDWCKENMTHYKVPKLVEFLDDLPKTMVGKVMRRQLMEKDPVYTSYHGNKEASGTR